MSIRYETEIVHIDEDSKTYNDFIRNVKEKLNEIKSSHNVVIRCDFLSTREAVITYKVENEDAEE